MNRRMSIVAIAAVTGLALAGCSSTPQTTGEATTSAPPAVSAAPAAFIAQAADSTAAAGSAAMTSTTTITGAPMGGRQDITVSADGVIDFAGSEASLQVTSPMMGGGAGMEVILADGVGYVKVPMFGDKWLSSPTKDLGLTMADPTQGLQTLRKAADLTQVGSEDIGGVATTKYTGTVDLSEAVGQLGLSASDERKAQAELEKIARTADVTVWVDDQDRVVRYDQQLAVDADGRTMQVSSSTSFSDFGVATDIQAPPADQVMDASKLKDLMPLAPGANS